MAQVTIDVNGKPYTVGCEDGQEPHLTHLASLFDRQVRQVSADVTYTQEMLVPLLNRREVLSFSFHVDGPAK